MKTGNLLFFSSIISFVAAIVFFAYLVNASKALSYLSTDPKACINCHVMNTQYATWQHSSHADRATCVECHLPINNMVDKYAAKARDGWNHSVAFTMNTFAQSIEISEDGANRVQANCKACHAALIQEVIANSDKYHDFTGVQRTDRKCWDCHRDVPHGKVRSLSSTPNALGVREL
ncbi:cytochrome c nitrite reductase small subunit [Desulforhopalus sp. IMCC35007]|uniref:cytochrome c nitrite reductase small subunit n=1 Tax=Desulforhopalus sp. IMCC35007 TaxID=2569543 RepID=UPI0010AEE5F7|nr:cytochrome c nitrite reductase small subunit [Desulforhopalus sp. IMCC35007]TKB09726.1 cytochrome c nitrite reductase small subunit [Desulforhopalus sp. IMCC35007]